MTNIVVNGQEQEIENATTLEHLLTHLAVQRRGTAVAVNGDIVPRATHSTYTVNDGDRIDIICAVAGG